MIPVRVLPCLLLQRTKLVKTLRFKDPVYVGDPRNAVRIFNEKEVDELAILDISATPSACPPDFQLIQEVVSEAFMPVAYGGGLNSVEQARAVLSCGVEKVVFSTHAVEDPRLVQEAACKFGSQSVVVCLDVKRTMFGRYEVFTRGATRRTRMNPVDCAKRVASMGAGEILVNSIDRDGTMQGFDIDLIRSVADAVRVPVIACGGAGSLDHVREAVVRGGASAVAAGSLFVFHGKHHAVLINYPKPDVLAQLFVEA